MKNALDALPRFPNELRGTGGVIEREFFSTMALAARQNSRTVKTLKKSSEPKFLSTEERARQREGKKALTCYTKQIQTMY